MKRNGLIFVSTIASLLLIVVILVTCIQLAANDDAWFDREYKKLDTSRQIGLSHDDIMASIGSMIDYMEGKKDSIQLEVTIDGSKQVMFNEREIQHMVDVRVLYQAWMTVRTIGAVAALLLLLFCMKMAGRDRLYVLSKGLLNAGIAFFSLLIVIGIWGALDFNSFWNAFHLLFFRNDLWLLDPNTSRMILICPLQLFLDLCVRFASWFFIALLLMLSFAVSYLTIRKKRRATPFASQEPKNDDRL